MLGACLLTMGALLVAADEPDPTEWVRRLGSDRFAERVEAAKALERLGPAALPALRAAKDSENPRIRVRVAALLGALDRGADTDRLTRPTLIKLDFRDRLLSDIVDELNARHNLGLTFQFGPLPRRGMIVIGPASPAQKAQEAEVRSRAVTLEAERALPFWEVVDRLCEVGQLQHDLHPQARFGLSTGRFLLFSGLDGTSVSSNCGPIRVKIAGLHSTLERDLVGATHPIEGRPPAPAAGQDDGFLLVRMVAIPEPGLVIRQLGRPTFVEAVDDRNRSLLRPEMKDAANGPSNVNLQPPTLNGPSGFEFSASLRLPDLAGRSIRRLRGSIPVVIVAYASHPIAIPLEGAADKSVRKNEVTVSVLEVATADTGQVTVEVEVTPNRPDGHEPDPWNRSGPPDFVTFRTNQLLNRLELLDAKGRELALSWNQGHGRDPMTINRRVRLTPTVIYEDQPPDAAGNFRERIGTIPVPVELRYHGFVQTLSEVRFDFHDIPLP
jgi:hypothetical protein